MFVSALLASLALGYADAIPEAAQAEPLKLHAIEHQIIEATNIERARYGLPPLEMDEDLVKSARRHAIWMTTRQILRHTSEAVGENIARGQPTVADVVGDWMRSPGHRANILHRQYQKIGVAAFVARDGRIYWCQQFLR
jgi:uncharacterized protein YkwD